MIRPYKLNSIVAYQIDHNRVEIELIIRFLLVTKGRISRSYLFSTCSLIDSYVRTHGLMSSIMNMGRSYCFLAR